MSLFDTGKYELNSISIKKNPFDYVYRYITTNKGKEGTIPITYKDFSTSIDYYYSNYSLPSLGQRIQKIDSRENVQSVNIKFTEPIKIGLEEIKDNFYLNYNKCTLQDDKQTLNCPISKGNDIGLYLDTKCEKKKLNYQLNYFSSSDHSDVSDRYYILPDSKSSVEFYFWYQSTVYNFPIKAYVNDEEFKIIKTVGYIRYYIYKNNKV